MNIRHAETAAEIARCQPLMRQLRPRLESAEQFLEIYRRQAAAGYRLLVRWSDETPLALAGYRISENLIHGQHIYIDDLVSDANSRNLGHGRALLEYLKSEAKSLGFGQLVLDTAITNVNAQRLYQSVGMSMKGYHLFMELD
ncbi:MAG: GNAT family N-acetyltransferase [Verrucomicrobiaceae bacterium]|nr:MAG: GNAT family N-acetyltransferase [Verrucomicrobiaceae bacterium]